MSRTCASPPFESHTRALGTLERAPPPLSQKACEAVVSQITRTNTWGGGRALSGHQRFVEGIKATRQDTLDPAASPLLKPKYLRPVKGMIYLDSAANIYRAKRVGGSKREREREGVCKEKRERTRGAGGRGGGVGSLERKSRRAAYYN